MPELDKDFPKLMEIQSNYDGADPENILARMPEELHKVPGEYRPYEDILQKLSDRNFKVFKSKVINRGKRDDLRGYQQFEDILYELLGYKYLEEQGYKRIEFIEEDQKRRTPDLEVTEKGELVCLLEVKRIHASDADAVDWKKTEEPNEWRLGSSKTGIPDGLKNKIKIAICEATIQLLSYSLTQSLHRIAYLFISLDLDYKFAPTNWDELTSFLRNEYGKDPEMEVLWKYVGLGAPK